MRGPMPRCTCVPCPWTVHTGFADDCAVSGKASLPSFTGMQMWACTALINISFIHPQVTLCQLMPYMHDAALCHWSRLTVVMKRHARELLPACLLFYQINVELAVQSPGPAGAAAHHTGGRAQPVRAAHN